MVAQHSSSGSAGSVGPLASGGRARRRQALDRGDLVFESADALASLVERALEMGDLCRPPIARGFGLSQRAHQVCGLRLGRRTAGDLGGERSLELAGRAAGGDEGGLGGLGAGLLTGRRRQGGVAFGLCDLGALLLGRGGGS